MERWVKRTERTLGQIEQSGDGTGGGAKLSDCWGHFGFSDCACVCVFGCGGGGLTIPEEEKIHHVIYRKHATNCYFELFGWLNSKAQKGCMRPSGHSFPHPALASPMTEGFCGRKKAPAEVAGQTLF